jgi:hypothetical protein
MPVRSSPSYDGQLDPLCNRLSRSACPGCPAYDGRFTKAEEGDEMSLEDRLGSFPEAWRPAPGDKIIGELTEFDTRSSDYGEPYPILTLLTDEGEEYAIHAFHTMLRNAVERKNPQIGDRVGIAYFGPAEKPAAPGMSPAERYRMIVERNSNSDEPPAVSESSEPEPAGPDPDDIPF